MSTGGPKPGTRLYDHVYVSRVGTYRTKPVACMNTSNSEKNEQIVANTYILFEKSSMRGNAANTMDASLASFSDEKEGHELRISNWMHSVSEGHIKSPASQANCYLVNVQLFSGNSPRKYLLGVIPLSYSHFARVSLSEQVPGSRKRSNSNISADMQPVDSIRSTQSEHSN